MSSRLTLKGKHVKGFDPQARSEASQMGYDPSPSDHLLEMQVRGVTSRESLSLSGPSFPNLRTRKQPMFPEHLTIARGYSKCLTYTGSFSSQDDPKTDVFKPSCSPLTDEEAEAQRGETTCSKSRSWYGTETGFQPGYSVPRSCLFGPHTIPTP